jgi:competence protein ComEC
VRSAILAKLKPKAWGGLAAALLLGTRENLEGALARAFRDAGLSHILALSGMHLAFLSGLLAFVLRRPLGKKGAVVAGLVFIVLYVFLVGPQPSLIRAAIMYVMGSFLILSGIQGQPLALLGAAFLVQTLWDPSSPYSLSFILSYLALGGILLLSDRAASLLRGLLPESLAGSIGASIGAFFTSAPVTAAFFGKLIPAGIIAGLIAAPLSGVFMALSLAWLAVEKLPLVGFVFGMIVDRLITFLQFFLQWNVSLFARLPGISAALPAVLIAAFLGVAALLVLAARLKQYRSYLAPFGL